MNSNGSDKTHVDYQEIAKQYEGELLYDIQFSQLGALVYGVLYVIGIKGLIVLCCILSIYNYYSKRGKEPKITFRHLLKSLPILKELRCYSKSSLSRVIRTLEEHGLIEAKRVKGYPNVIYPTNKAIEMMNFKLQKRASESEGTVSAKEKQGVSVSKKHCVSAKEKRGVPAKEKHNSINNRDNNNVNIDSESKLEIDTDKKIESHQDEALAHFQSLSPEDRRMYDALAYNLLDFGCPMPKPGSEEMERLRVEHYIVSNNL